MVGVLEADKNNVHADTYAIDDDKLPHHFLGYIMVGGSKEPRGRVHIYCTDNELLNAEARKLNSLNDIELVGPCCRIRRIGSKEGDNGWYMQCGYVEENHGKNKAERPLISNNKMESRIKYKCLLQDLGVSIALLDRLMSSKTGLQDTDS